ncbi:MAG: hypothetical protein ABI178_10580 [Rhodanobacter sp.]
MDQYCVVLCGLQAGTSDEAAAWQPVAAALKLDLAEFEQRVVDALPRIVRQDLDQDTANRIAHLLHAMHVDARVLPDDPQLAYIERAGAGFGPLPWSSLGDFIRPGESYRLYGSTTWQPWVVPVVQASVASNDEVGDVDDAPPSASTDDGQVNNMPAPPPADVVSESIDAAAGDTTGGTIDEPQHATTASDEPLHFSEIAPLEHASHGTASELDAAAPAHDDDLENPPQPAPEPDAPGAHDSTPAELAETSAPRRSRTGRLVLLVVLAALAVWAYRYWTANTRVAPPPGMVEAIQPSGVDPGRTTPPARVVHRVDSTIPPASPVSAAVAASTPASATTASAPAVAGSTPAPAASASMPAAAASTPAPATSARAPAQSVTSALPASAGTIMSAKPAPAAARSANTPATPGR